MHFIFIHTTDPFTALLKDMDFPYATSVIFIFPDKTAVTATQRDRERESRNLPPALDRCTNPIQKQECFPRSNFICAATMDA